MVQWSQSSPDDLINLFSETTKGIVDDELILVDDLDFSGINITAPLGGAASSCIAFSGVLHGCGHSIKHFAMSNITYSQGGLFCNLMSATIEDLLIDETCSFIGKAAGALSAVAIEGVVVRNVTNRAKVVGEQFVGGLIGFVSISERASLSFDACANHGRITSNSAYAGGFIGRMSGCSMIDVTITNSVNNGFIGSSKNVGGFIGGVAEEGRTGTTEYMISVLNSSNHGNVTSSEDNTGGFIGTVYNVTKFAVSFSGSTNAGRVSGSNRLGGFIGHILSGIGSVNISDCQNDGNVTASNAAGGFVGSIYDVQGGTVVIKNARNKGSVGGSNYMGGFIGELYANIGIGLDISNAENMASISGFYYVSGFIGSVAKSGDTGIIFSGSINSGNVVGDGSVGGFIGNCISNQNITLGVHRCVSSGSIGGREGVAGFIGTICPSISGVFSLEITNSIGSGIILTNGKNACGMFCVYGTMNSGDKAMVYNSMSKGVFKITSSTTAYGIANDITRAVNVVSMVNITASSSSHLFWGQSNDVSLFYGFNGNCPNCLTDDAALFKQSESNGLYELIESGRYVDDVLNDQVTDVDARWTFDLSLTLDNLGVKVGKPVNRYLFIDPVNPLDNLASLCEVFMNECIIVDNTTKMPIHDSSSIKKGSVVLFCYNVVVSGIISDSYYVEMDTQMKGIKSLSPFFNEQYGVVSFDSGTRVVFNSASVVSKSMRIMVVKKLRVVLGKPYTQVVYVYPGDTLGEIEKEHGLQLDGFVFIAKDTQTILTKLSVIETDIYLKLCHDVTLSGVFTGSFFVEHGNTLGDIKELQPFWNNDFTLLDATNKSKVYTNMTTVLDNMTIVIIKNTRVIVEIDLVDDVNTTDIINSITDIISVDPSQIIVDVVRNDDGRVTGITITVIDEETATTIVDKINSIDTGSDCGAGVLCRRKRAYIEVEISCGHFPFVSLFAFFVALFVQYLF